MFGNTPNSSCNWRISRGCLIFDIFPGIPRAGCGTSDITLKLTFRFCIDKAPLITCLRLSCTRHHPGSTCVPGSINTLAASGVAGVVAWFLACPSRLPSSTTRAEGDRFRKGAPLLRFRPCGKRGISSCRRQSDLIHFAPSSQWRVCMLVLRDYARMPLFSLRLNSPTTERTGRRCGDAQAR